MSSSSSFKQNEDDYCSRCQSKTPITSNNTDPSRTILPNCVPSTSTTPYEQQLSSSEDVSCARIRQFKFVKNYDKSIPAPSEQFLVGVNCAVIKLLQEIEENHKLCKNKRPNRSLPKSRKRQ